MEYICWTYFVLVAVFITSASALQCYWCHYDTSQNENVCNTTAENCTADLTSCMTQTQERHDRSRIFTRSCVPPQVCKPDYCEENVIKAIGRKDCNITCCQEDFCNRDGYSPTVGGKGHVAHAHWSLGYFSLIVATWVPLLERLL